MIKKLIITFFCLLILILFYINSQISALVARIDKNCSNFKTQIQAQEEFEKHTKDIYRLDGDKDGIPCESLKGGE